MSSVALSVIIPQGPETGLTRDWCAQELEGMSYEIIVASSWRRGLISAKGEFVSFIEKDCVLSKGYFRNLMETFDEHTSYRKLAMVTPTLAVDNWDTQVYGYILTPTSVMPSRIKSSTSTYLIQIGFMPGAIIRRSSLKVAPLGRDNLMESVNFSVQLWNTGQRIAINPSVVYVSTDNSLEFPRIERRRSKTIELTVTMWKREMIG